MVMKILIMILGLISVIFHKQIGTNTTNTWYRVWNAENMSDTKPSLSWQFYEKAYQFIYLIGGIFSIIISLLALLGVIQWKD